MKRLLKAIYLRVFRRKALFVKPKAGTSGDELLKIAQANKLHAETTDLNRHFWKNLAAFTTLAVAVLAAVNTKDWFDGKTQHLEARRERLEMAVERLHESSNVFARASTTLSNQVDTLSNQVALLKVEKDGLERTIIGYSNEVATLALAKASLERTNAHLQDWIATLRLDKHTMRGQSLPILIKWLVTSRRSPSIPTKWRLWRRR